MSKHTPGPWEINGAGNFDICELDLIRITANHPIADDGPDRTLADARLIASAPELLSALEEITRCAKMRGPAGTTAYLISDSRMDAARAAIARAKGGGA